MITGYKMKVFTDLHHGDLYFSLKRLFEDRLGFELYRPIGLDWFHEGYWQIAKPYNHAMDTVNQYLAIGGDDWDQYKDLNGGTNNYVEDNVYHIWEPVHEYHQKAITFDTFKDMDIDIIMSTVVLHDRPYEKMRDVYKPNAKIIAHLGNTGQRTHLPNVIHSVPYRPAPGQNTVLVHQELDPNIYKYVKPSSETKNIFSVVNCFPYPHVFNQYKAAMPDVDMRAYGAGSPDGSLFGCRGVAEKMREANIAWHLKPQGGLGHSAMGWMMSGRPLITNMSQNRSWGGNAVALFEPGVTCFDIERGTIEENVAAIRTMLEPEENVKWSERVKQRFHDVINYDAEEEKTRRFIERLI